MPSTFHELEKKARRRTHLLHQPQLPEHREGVRQSLIPTAAGGHFAEVWLDRWASLLPTASSFLGDGPVRVRGGTLSGGEPALDDFRFGPAEEEDARHTPRRGGVQ